MDRGIDKNSTGFQSALARLREEERLRKEKTHFKLEYHNIRNEVVMDSDMLRLHMEIALAKKDKEEFDYLYILWKGTLLREKVRREHKQRA